MRVRTASHTVCKQCEYPFPFGSITRSLSLLILPEPDTPPDKHLFVPCARSPMLMTKLFQNSVHTSICEPAVGGTMESICTYSCYIRTWAREGHTCEKLCNSITLAKCGTVQRTPDCRLRFHFLLRCIRHDGTEAHTQCPAYTCVQVDSWPKKEIVISHFDAVNSVKKASRVCACVCVSTYCRYI